MNTPPEMITFTENTEIVARLDEMARSEGTSRSALIRRAIRGMLSSVSRFPESGTIAQSESTQPAEPIA